MRIVLSGGGTGGHIAPLASVAKELTKDGHELHYIGEGSTLESRMLNGVDLQSHRILAGKFRRYRGSSLLAQLLDLRTLVLNIRDLFKFLAGFIQGMVLLVKIRPQAVFSKGGYVALPVGLAAAILRIPIITHDSDTTPGLTNRILNRFAAAKACGFPREGSIFTGNPVRRDIIERPKTDLGTPKPVVLFLGGSSGARRINTIVFDTLAELTQKYFVVHITGQKEFSKTPESAEDYKAYAFVDEQLGGLIKAADVVVSRAGANIITELAASSRAVVLIPASQLTAGQQLKNAEQLKSKDAAYVLNEDDLNPRSLMRAIAHTLGAQKLYSRNIKQFYRENAASELATLITQHGKLS